jgi:UDP:flavonoid glycosyltransferase YjiC (YdhE family)
MIHNAGAGPSPISPKNLNVDTLAEAISVVFSPEAQTAARTMGQQIRSENGVEEGVDSFHRHLPLLNMWYVAK